MMAAYSLRTWRRNGIACDELLFLPGTHHGQEHGIDGPLVELPVVTPVAPGASTSTSTSVSTPPPSGEALARQSSDPLTREADMAGGGGGMPSYVSSPSQNRLIKRARSDDEVELVNMGATTANNSTEGRSRASSNDESSKMAQGQSLLGSKRGNGMLEEGWDDEVSSDELEPSGTQTLLHRATISFDADENDTDNTSGSTPERPNRVERFRDSHPILARLGTFFFFRSSGSTTNQNAAYAPSGPAVFGAGLDLSMPVLFNFHLFIEAFNHIQGAASSAMDEDDENSSETSTGGTTGQASSSFSAEANAKILPIIFLSVLIVRTMVPPGRRMRFWGTMKFTFTAPFHQVRVRDEFICDCLTSWVRPGQDLFFGLSYWGTVIWGSITGRYGLTASGEILSESWLLHNVIMPAFAILPLWLKYLQTLRQAYDSNQRWPYQGNSLKYLSASLVIIYGITHPEQRSSPFWLSAWVIALLYQIFWDVVMDWQLFEIQRDITIGDTASSESENSWCARVSSFRPESTILLALQMYFVQPVLDRYQRLRAYLPNWRQIQLREERLYKTESFYWKIFIFNTLTRFTWMCCFIPAYHISRGSRTVLTSKSDVNSYWGVLLPVTEIVRRTLWGFLYMEKETLKIMETDGIYQRVASASGEIDDDDEQDEMNSKVGDHRSFRNLLLPTWLDNQQQVAHKSATTRAKQHEQFARQVFVVELYVWAAAFVVLGGWLAQ